MIGAIKSVVFGRAENSQGSCTILLCSKIRVLYRQSLGLLLWRPISHRWTIVDIQQTKKNFPLLKPRIKCPEGRRIRLACLSLSRYKYSVIWPNIRAVDILLKRGNVVYAYLCGCGSWREWCILSTGSVTLQTHTEWKGRHPTFRCSLA